MPMRFQKIDGAKVTQTIEILCFRIEERFPEANLRNVCRRLHEIARRTNERCEWISTPHWPLRIGFVSVIVLALIGLVVSMVHLEVGAEQIGLFGLVQVVEAGLNDLIIIGAAIFFLVSIESRIKRARILEAVHELRGIAHVVDLHQLTKDPEAVLSPGRQTEHSPDRKLDAFLLSRYLDYCAEMLSLTGKLGALYIQDFSDESAVRAVNELENLTASLSRKVWQKLSILHLDRQHNHGRHMAELMEIGTEADQDYQPRDLPPRDSGAITPGGFDDEDDFDPLLMPPDPLGLPPPTPQRLPAGETARRARLKTQQATAVDPAQHVDPAELNQAALTCGGNFDTTPTPDAPADPTAGSADSAPLTDRQS